MKNLLLAAILLGITLNSCSEKQTENTVPSKESNVMLDEPKPIDSATIAANAAPASPEAEGLKLIEGADCLACHKMDAKLVGPSYQDVAAKYTEADIDQLSTKIIEGGKGVWGEIPMTAHTGMSKENAQKMVKYILSLKK